MVVVGSALCVDRFETSLADRTSGQDLSPYYHPDPALAARDFHHWDARRTKVGPFRLRSQPLPPLPDFQRNAVVPVARSLPGRIPSAYLDMQSAKRACENAGKRLCKHQEWLLACRGQEGRRFPYGEHYEPGRCNVSRELHPATILHGKYAFGQLDPRLNLVESKGTPLLRKTGESPECVSHWGEDAIHDMVGNLDEWIDDPRGTFLGGFYARDMPWGCDARIEIHSADYYDYSIGARCCRDQTR